MDAASSSRPLLPEEGTELQIQEREIGPWLLVVALPQIHGNMCVGAGMYREDRAQVGAAAPLPYPDTDSGDVVGTDSSDGLLSSLAVGGGWDMPEAGAGGKDVEDSGAAVGEASGGTEVPGLVLACDTQKKEQASISLSGPNIPSCLCPALFTANLSRAHRLFPSSPS